MIKKYLKHFSFFYDYLGHRIFINMLSNISVGLMDGFGLVMFLPLLQMVGGDKSVTSDDLGNLRFLTDGIQKMGFELTLNTILAIMLLFFVLKGAMRFGESYYKTVMQNHFVKAIRLKSLKLLKEYRYKAFVNSDSGRIQNTLTGEVIRVAGASAAYFNTLQGIIMVLVYSFLAFLANPQFAIMVLIGGMLSNFIFSFINKKTITSSRMITREGHEFQGLLIQEVSFFKYLKATGLLKSYSNKLENIVKSIDRNNRQIGFYGAILYSCKEPIIMLVVVSVIYIQTTVFSQSLGLIILSLLFFYRSLTFLMSLQTFYNTFLSSAGAVENMQEFFKDLENEKEVKIEASKVDFDQTIELRDVKLNYGNKTVLDDINLTIKKNESVALVGESGSGKTTLVNLITGLIPTDRGELLVDGKSLKEISLQDFQNSIGYITQEPVIFSDTIFNNVTFWEEKTPENLKKFWKALEQASIADFVHTLEHKEDALMGNNGILVSGGQKQRISIARELYRDIDILIMDEATSALDSETERIIQNNLDALKGKYTILIIAHRLATVKNVDKVILLSNGKIENEGNFETLMNNSGAFKRMVDMQGI